MARKTVSDVPSDKMGEVVQILVDDGWVKIEAQEKPNGNWDITATKPNA